MKTDYKGIEIDDYFIVMKWIEKEGKCMFDLHKELNLTYCHLHQLKKSFLKLNWIYIEKDFRRHNMYLTDKGKEIVKIATELFSLMGFDEAKILEYIEKSKSKKVNINKEKLIKEIEESVPEEQVPEEQVPEEQIPDKSVPEEQVPEEQVPDKSVPEEQPTDDDILDYNIEDEWKVE
jgi:DNA-binding MarR family transcriptional regulator